MDFLKDLWGFLKNRKKFWLLPLIVIMLMFGALLLFAGGSAIAPFIYTLFGNSSRVIESAFAGQWIKKESP